jgi:hypothetical protein
MTSRTANPPLSEEPAAAALGPDRLGMSLQLSRASMMALTRLQLAIQNGDRQQTLAAMDRLHALDAEMERLVGRLPPPADNDSEWGAITRHVSDQKLAIAFEKLALVSEISGPDLVSPQPAPLAEVPRAPGPAQHDLPPLPDWPALPAVEPAEWRPAPRGLAALALALLVTALLAAAAVLMTTV